jgi:hypothetical protein
MQNQVHNKDDKLYQQKTCYTELLIPMSIMSIILWDMTPHSPVETYWCFDPLKLKMEAAYSSEMLVNFYQTTWYHIPGDGALQNKLCQFQM